MGKRHQWIFPLPPSHTPKSKQMFSQMGDVVANFGQEDLNINHFIADCVGTMLGCEWLNYGDGAAPTEWESEDFNIKLHDHMVKWIEKQGGVVSQNMDEAVWEGLEMLEQDLNDFHPWIENVYRDHILAIVSEIDIERILSSQVVGDAVIVIGEIA